MSACRAAITCLISIVRVRVRFCSAKGLLQSEGVRGQDGETDSLGVQ